MNSLLFILPLLLLLFLLFQYIYLRKERKKRVHSLVKNWGKSHEGRYINFDRTKQYFLKSRYSSIAFQAISANSIHDLDLHDVFRFINRTMSSIGEQFLYFKLLTLDTPQEKNKLTPLVRYFKENKKERIEIQQLLSELKSPKGYNVEKLIHDRHLTLPSHYEFYYLSSFATISALVLSIWFPFLLIILIPLFIVNMGMHYYNKKNIDKYSEGLYVLFKMMKVKPELEKYFDTEIKAISIDKLQQLRFYSFFIHFASNHDQDPLAQLVIWNVELLKIFLNVEVISFYKCIQKLEKHKETIEELFQYIGMIDAAQSIANVQSGELTTCQPSFSNHFNVEAITHPLIHDCVANSFSLDKKGMLLTGSNMSGKTTFIRTVAINAIFAQAFDFCFGEKYNAPYFKIYTSIRISDNLREKTSYYLQEVKSIKKIVDASQTNTPCLFVMDELFKGTNTLERIKSANAILSYLNKGPHYTFVATHDLELTALQASHYELWHFAEVVEKENVYFDHKLKKGKLSRFNAIKILKLNNYPEEIINTCLDT
ncbi:MutS-related protein [Flammeovirga aprica]|uniref:DNA mismatch repair protein MutS n=1 Tax=Flammeovirga aprica JL-4 TaxID=694437 RepID=A0A7X9P2U6_9BACT|nr:DNA mismatch repair protein MutS [Flammeovirga aprica]NME68529.1 DNA mismatch repair protein MutS [Flammeovirga aprica JL-4]